MTPDERSVHSKWCRKYYHWYPGVKRWAKRYSSKRERQAAKKDVTRDPHLRGHPDEG